MKNIYNKGKYRSGEYAKHLRPFLKTHGNRMWRRTAKKEIEKALAENQIPKLQEPKRVSRKQKKTIKIKAKKYLFKDFTRTYVKKYRTIRSALDSLKRNNVIDGRILNHD